MSKKQENVGMQKIFGNAKFDVEHALVMYAANSCTLFAEDIYNKDTLASMMDVIEKCHIYLIGYTPAVRLVDARQDNTRLDLDLSVGTDVHTVSIDLPAGLCLMQQDGNHFLRSETGEDYWPGDEYLKSKLDEVAGPLYFDVKYIGQAYGRDGSRNAIDRLLKHETLQKIAIKGVPEGHRITLLLLSTQANNQLFTLFNPFAVNKDGDGKRIRAGLDKLFNTTEEERVSLYEAALIRYFYPEFNKEFKDSFPSTNLKILQDCYEKDLGGVVAEICIDTLSFRLRSEKVAPRSHHIARHSLHKEDDRRVFFGL